MTRRLSNTVALGKIRLKTDVRAESSKPSRAQPPGGQRALLSDIESSVHRDMSLRGDGRTPGLRQGQGHFSGDHHSYPGWKKNEELN